MNNETFPLKEQKTAKSWSKNQVAFLGGVSSVLALASCLVNNLEEQDKKQLQENLGQISSIFMKNLQNIYNEIPSKESLKTIPEKVAETAYGFFTSYIIAQRANEVATHQQR
jgi:hypothetical protein